ncbi:MAG: 50S ribosomal protein L15 [Rhizobiaceae bacterium]|nr:50S ribosomal protein L15 [Hyphomicrobiales bacterium]NRB32005.1 50S ribosomal protein L15 [Rhizobiaceae bacterium]
MKLNGISDNQGSSPSRKRVGRGIGSGMGKTGGRGVKGQKSRSGVSINGFEGGQMPIYRRLPKRGFSNAKFASDFNEVSIARLEQAVEAKRLDAKKVVDAAALKEAGVIRRERDGVRILGGSEAKTKFNLEVAGASKSAVAAIEKAGGSIKLLGAAKAEAESADA